MSERAMELNDLLKELHSEGSLDSAGRFSLDLSKAKDKLQEFQLQNRWDYSLKLVQAAVAAGASYIKVDCNNQKAHFRYDGKNLQPRELTDLFYYLVEETERPQTRHLRSLASAINTAVATGARQIWLDCWDGKQGFRHLFSAEGRKQTELPRQHEKPYTEFVLLRSISDVAKGWWHTGNCDVWDLLTRSRNTMEKEQASIFDKCPFCPIPVKLNGKMLNRFTFGEPRWPGYDIHKDAHPGDSVPPWWVRFGNPDYTDSGVHRYHHLVERYVPASPNCLCPLRSGQDCQASIEDGFAAGQPCEAILAIQAQLSREASLAFIEDGVILEFATPTMPVAGVVGLVSSHGLSKDLSGFKVVKNEAYEQRIQMLRGEVEQMKSALEAGKHRLPSEVRHRLGLHISATYM